MEVGKQLKFTERNIKVQDQRGQIPRKTNANVCSCIKDSTNKRKWQSLTS